MKIKRTLIHLAFFLAMGFFVYILLRLLGTDIFSSLFLMFAVGGIFWMINKKKKN